MKKGIILLMVFCMLLGIAGCDNGPGGEPVDENKIEQTYTFETGLTEKTYYPESTGRTFYVSASGSDANDGLSKDTPLKSIMAVNGLVLQPGDSVLFKGGDAFNGTLRLTASGSDDNPITIAGYDNETERPKLVANMADTIIATNVSNIVIRDLELVPVSAERTSANPGPKQTGILFINNANTDTTHKNIYIHNNHVISSGPLTNSDGIAFVGEYLSLDDMPEFAVSNIYVTNNLVEEIGRSGIFTSQNELMTLYRNVNFIGNTVRRAGQIGMYIGSATDSRMLRNNIIEVGIFDKPFVMEGAGGMMAIACDTCDIMYNVACNGSDGSASLDGMGIDIDWNTTNVNVQYNHTYGNKGGGIGTMANQNSFIRNNRMEGNECNTNMTAQCQVSAFTVYDKPGVADNMHGVTNLKITDNLIINDKSDKGVFRTLLFNGSTVWTGNEFTGNHLISTTSTDDYWVTVDPETPWYKFADNKYYKNDTSSFKCLDGTALADINSSEGAQAYVYDGKFESWAKRDVGATFETIATDLPERVSNVAAKWEDGKLQLTWDKSAGNLWHYNVYCIDEGEELSYTNMLGETKTESFAFAFENTMEKIIVIQPESNQGNYGKSYRIRVTLA